MMSLAPKKSSGYDICEEAGLCQKVCVGYSGSSQMDSRIRKTILLHIDQQSFFTHLIKDIVSHVKKYNADTSYKNKLNDDASERSVKNANNKQLNPVIRLNGYSDIPWEDKKYKFKFTQEIKDIIKKYIKFTYTDPYLQGLVQSPSNIHLGQEVTIFELFPDLIFYDYTKYIDRKNLPKNYHLTFSFDKGRKNIFPNSRANISVIVTSDLLDKLTTKKNTHLNRIYTFINGDQHDFRPFDDNSNPQEIKFILLNFQENSKEDKISNYAITDEDEFEILIINPLLKRSKKKNYILGSPIF